MKTLQVLYSKVAHPYLLRISFGKCLSGSVSDSAKAAGPPDADAGTPGKAHPDAKRTAAGGLGAVDVATVERR